MVPDTMIDQINHSGFMKISESMETSFEIDTQAVSANDTVDDALFDISDELTEVSDDLFAVDEDLADLSTVLLDDAEDDYEDEMVELGTPIVESIDVGDCFAEEDSVVVEMPCESVSETNEVALDFEFDTDEVDETVDEVDETVDETETDTSEEHYEIEGFSETDEVTEELAGFDAFCSGEFDFDSITETDLIDTDAGTEIPVEDSQGTTEISLDFDEDDTETECIETVADDDVDSIADFWDTIGSDTLKSANITNITEEVIDNGEEQEEKVQETQPTACEESGETDRFDGIGTEVVSPMIHDQNTLDLSEDTLFDNVPVDEPKPVEKPMKKAERVQGIEKFGVVSIGTVPKNSSDLLLVVHCDTVEKAVRMKQGLFKQGKAYLVEKELISRRYSFEFYKSVTNTRQLDISDCDVLYVVKALSKGTVQETKSKNGIVFNKDMTINKFLQANPNVRSVEQVEEYFSTAIINKAHKAGVFEIRKGRIIF